MTKAATTTETPIVLSYGNVRFASNAKNQPVNTPKFSPSAIAVQEICKLVGTNLREDGKLTPFGHMAKSQGGIIDQNILKGATTLNGLAMGLSGASTRKSDPDSWGKSCKRVKDHIHWMATQPASHGGFFTRLKKVHKNPKTIAKKLLKQLAILDETVQASFSAEYNNKGIPLA